MPLREKTDAICRAFTEDAMLVLVVYSLYRAVAYSSYVTNFGLSTNTLGYVSNMPFMIGASTGILVSGLLIILLYRKACVRAYSLDYRAPILLIVLAYLAAAFLPQITDQETLLVGLGIAWGLATTVISIAIIELLSYESSPIVLIIQLACGSLFSAILSVSMQNLPDPFGLVLGIAFILATAPLISICRKKIEPYRIDGERKALFTSLKNSSTPIMACAFFELVTGLINMYSFLRQSVFAISTQAPIQGLIICAVLVTIFVLFTSRVPNQQVIYLGVFPGIIAIFLLVPFFSDTISKPVSTVIYSAYIFTSMLSTFCYITACRESRSNIYGVAALVAVFIRICLMIGLAAGSFFANLSEGETFIHLSIVCVVCVYLLGIVIVLWSYRSSKEKRAVEIVVQPVPETFEEAAAARADRLVAEYGLTGRERDVLLGLAQGNTAATIADRLCISTSTAQGYIKNLYAKLGVNRKQQVIDLFSEQAQAAGESHPAS
jgi:DNA-binding CsgD family transcriptional regulator